MVLDATLQQHFSVSGSARAGEEQNFFDMCAYVHIWGHMLSFKWAEYAPSIARHSSRTTVCTESLYIRILSVIFRLVMLVSNLCILSFLSLHLFVSVFIIITRILFFLLDICWKLGRSMSGNLSPVQIQTATFSNAAAINGALIILWLSTRSWTAVHRSVCEWPHVWHHLLHAHGIAGKSQTTWR